MAQTAPAKKTTEFDPRTFLATIGEGRKVMSFLKKQTIFAQGDAADAVFYVQQGKVRLSVVSKTGKEATLGILSDGQFFGEGSLAGQTRRMGSATAMTECELLRIEKRAMMLALHREHEFSDLFVAYLLARNIRYEEDLVDQLFNSSEKRCATVAVASSLRQRRSIRGSNSQDQSGNSCGNDRNDAFARQLFYEPVPRARLPRLRREWPAST
jgi:CRP-like cAMP-binding protein